MARGRHRKKPQRNWSVELAGAALVLAGAGIVASMVGYRVHAEHVAAGLTHRLATAPTTVRILRGDASNPPIAQCSAPPPSAAAPRGTPRMVLTIPRIGVTAPVLAGTADRELDVAVGHLDSSAWPDSRGTTVLEAHDVTFFANLDHVRPGDRIGLTAPCRNWSYAVTSARVVPAGTPITNTLEPSLVLVTCWPTDALFYTDQRFVVTARLSAAGTASRVLPQATQRPVVRPALPRAFRGRRLSVDLAGIPLGRLHLSAQFAPSWRQSAQAFAASQAATALLTVAMLSAREHHADWWHTIAPRVPWSTGQLLAEHPVWTSQVDVTVRGGGATVAGAALQGDIRLGNDGQRRGFRVTVTTTVSGGVMTITSIDLTR